jgi:phosphate transport system permease protein
MMPAPKPNLALSPPVTVRAPRRRRRSLRAVSLLAQGEPMLWLTGGGLALALVMILGLLALVVWQGTTTFWPVPVVQVTTPGGIFAGEVTREERYRPRSDEIAALPAEMQGRAQAALVTTGGWATRRLVRTGNYELTNEHFNWISDFQVKEERRPKWMLVLERQAWGRFYGLPKAFRIDGQTVTEQPADVWRLFQTHHSQVRARWNERRHLETEAVGNVNARQEAARLAVRAAELKYGPQSLQFSQASAALQQAKQGFDAEFTRIRGEIDRLNKENARYQILLVTADGKEQGIALADIVRAYPANQLTVWQRAGLYAARWWEFLADEPREANSEGGVMPAIFGTVTMTLIMSLVVVPFGVLAALYLREYAKPGPVVSAVRIAINNLAGVPSIVFGVFGLGFFSYIVGVAIDQLFYVEKLPNPTFGTGGLMWASLTLALLTLPVVIVATEEALAAVPGSMREGSYACGASKWQTIRRIVLPRAMPGIMTGMILAMARGAGEVAPLMLVGAVKLAPELPVDSEAPFVHLSRSFMHLGFHIYDLGFQSQNSEAAKPMVYTTTLLLILIIAVLNIVAVVLRSRLRRKFLVSQF